MNQVAAAVTIALSLGAGWLVPALAVHALVRTLADGPLLVRNYAGRRIPPVLGLAWLVWVIALLGVQVLLDVAVESGWQLGSVGAVIERIGTTPLALPVYVSPLILVAGCVALGMADDAFGGSGPKGFAGHLDALRHGRLTTGMLKMLGIGVIAVFYAATAAPGVLGKSDPGGTRLAGAGWFVLAWLLAALVIALSANLMNLLDLRPGRALKVYVLAVPAPAVLFALASVAAYNADAASYAAEIADLVLQPWEAGVAAAALVIVLLGPAVAVWSADLGERAMLGDAGANTMGAVVGYLLTAVLDLTGLAIAAAVLLALNLLSERISFSDAIDRIAPLRMFDRLGRLAEAPGKREVGAGGAPRRPDVRYHSDEEPVTEED